MLVLRFPVSYCPCPCWPPLVQPPSGVRCGCLLWVLSPSLVLLEMCPNAHTKVNMVLGPLTTSTCTLCELFSVPVSPHN